MLLTTAIAQFVESGVSSFVATTDNHSRPDVMRALGSRVGAGLDTVCVFLPEALAARTLSNLQVNPRIALTTARVLDHKTLQLKGELCGVRAANADDRAHMQAYLTGFAEQLYVVGLPKSLFERIRWWPAVAVEFVVSDIFEQTPGPGTGARLSSEELARALR
jgi:Pyridoxamine 5'-phosphate oxidase